MENNYSTVTKGGRCWNGAHRDGGIVVHIIEGSERNGFWGGKALCGTQPGLRSYGWAKTDKESNCEECKKKHASIVSPINDQDGK